MRLCNRVALLNKGVLIECGTLEAVCGKYSTTNTVEILLKNGSKITLANDATSADKITILFKTEQIVSIHSSEPDLETVFLSLMSGVQ